MTQRILVVEDNVSNALLMIDILEATRRYLVLKAGNGVEALEITRREVPDLILMDVMLPDKNGIQVIKELKADPRLATIPIIALTASSHSDLQRQVEEAGGDAFVTKPFTRKILLDAVEKLLPPS